jgi:hypothetical protein
VLVAYLEQECSFDERKENVKYHRNSGAFTAPLPVFND